MDLAYYYVHNIYPKPMIQQQIDSLISRLNCVLDNGCTYQSIKSAMTYAASYKKDLDWNYLNTSYRNSENRNLLVSGTRYYHKELVIRNKAPIVTHDIDNGTLVSQSTEFFVEPRASYTINEFIDYFYEKINPNREVYNRKRLFGFFGSMLKTYDIETLLFIVEALAMNNEKCGNAFTFVGITDYYATAKQFLSDLQHNCAESGVTDYVFRKRM